ncbi:MAG: hypothetical protein AAGD14_01785 [Planctomycetota bacterium]
MTESSTRVPSGRERRARFALGAATAIGVRIALFLRAGEERPKLLAEHATRIPIDDNLAENLREFLRR